MFVLNVVMDLHLKQGKLVNFALQVQFPKLESVVVPLVEMVILLMTIEQFVNLVQQIPSPMEMVIVLPVRLVKFPLLNQHSVLLVFVVQNMTLLISTVLLVWLVISLLMLAIHVLLVHPELFRRMVNVDVLLAGTDMSLLTID